MNHRRDAAKERHWRALIDKQRRSGLTTRQFCLREGLDESSFYRWRRQLRVRALERSLATESCAGLEPNSRGRRGASSHNENPSSVRSPEPPVFMPIRVVEDRAACMEVALECGATLRIPAGFDFETLRGVIELLEHPPC